MQGNSFFIEFLWNTFCLSAHFSMQRKIVVVYSTRAREAEGEERTDVKRDPSIIS